jgi:hypothetical protein
MIPELEFLIEPVFETEIHPAIYLSCESNFPSKQSKTSQLSKSNFPFFLSIKPHLGLSSFQG